MTRRVFDIKSIIVVVGLSCILMLNIVLLSPSSVSAAATSENCAKNSNRILGFPTWYKYLDPTFIPAERGIPARCNVDFVLTNPGDLGKVVLAITEILLRVGGIVAVGFILYGGFMFIISQGEPQKSVAARRTILNAIIGVVIAGIAVFIVQIVATNLL